MNQTHASPAQSTSADRADAASGLHGGALNHRWRDWLALLLVAGSALAAVRVLWQPGVPNPGDFLLSLYRAFELERALDRGMLYPRFGPDLNFGYSAPLFHFYPPLAAYLTLAVHKLGLGYGDAAKALLTAALMAGGSGVYLVARLLLGQRVPALVAALLYLFSPYLLLVIYERGAVAEAMALALLPWLFWSFQRLLIAPGVGRGATAGVVAALLLTAHNITALIALPTVALLFALQALWDRQPRRLLYGAGALALGLGLSAFYWLPALAEARFTRMESQMLGAAYAVVNELRTPATLLQESLAALYAGPQRFRLAPWTLLLGVLGTVGLIRQRPWRRPVALFMLIFWLLAGAQLVYAAPLWEGLPLVRYLQFPWRLFGMMSLLAAVGAGATVAALAPRGRRGRWITQAAALLLVPAAALVALPNLRTDPAHLPFWYALDQESIGVADLFARGSRNLPADATIVVDAGGNLVIAGDDPAVNQDTFALFSDYMPRAMQLGDAAMALSRPPGLGQLPPLEADPAVVVRRAEPMAMQLQVTADAPWTLRVHRVFFPGWQVQVDGAPIETRGTGLLGLVTAQIPAGEHRVDLRYAATPIRRLGEVLSILALAGLALLLTPRRRGPFLPAAAALTAVALVVLGMAWPRLHALAPTAQPADLGDELRLLGYHMGDPSFRPGQEIPLRLYWLVRRTPAADYKLFVHLVKPDDSGRVAQLDQEPALGYNHTTLWEPGEIIEDSYRFPIPADAPAGSYLLVMGVYHPETVRNLLVRNAGSTLPGDRVVLGQVEIRDE